MTLEKLEQFRSEGFLLDPKYDKLVPATPQNTGNQSAPNAKIKHINCLKFDLFNQNSNKLDQLVLDILVEPSPAKVAVNYNGKTQTAFSRGFGMGLLGNYILYIDRITFQKGEANKLISFTVNAHDTSDKVIDTKTLNYTIHLDGKIDEVGEVSLVKEKEEVEKQTYKWSHSPFGNLIAEIESSNNYNICNKITRVKGVEKVIVVDDTIVVDTKIKEIQTKQKKKELFAVGRYQLIPETLKLAIRSLKLDVNLNLDSEMQDKIFDKYLIKIKRHNIIKFLEGKGSVEQAMYDSAKEWASVGVEKGKKISKNRIAEGGESYYADDGLNKALVTPERIKEILIISKNENK